MKRYRICKLDGCDVWRVQVLATARWPFRLWVAPRWLPVKEWSIFAIDCPSFPVERGSFGEAVALVERYERHDAEVAARKAKAWKCGAA